VDTLNLLIFRLNFNCDWHKKRCCITIMTEDRHFEILPPALPKAENAASPPLTAEESVIIEQLEKLARAMDSAVNIPGLNFRVGADGVLGLLMPVVGDVIAAAASGYIVIQAHKLGLPPVKLAQMAANILIDTGVGAIPFAGDLLDIAIKANLKNVDMIREHFLLPPMSRTWEKAGI